MFLTVGPTTVTNPLPAMRWLENARIADLLLMPGVGQYVNQVNMEKRVPTCQSFKIVSEAIRQFLKPDILQESSLVTKIDLSNNNLMPAKQIDIGFATQNALRRSAKIATEAYLLMFKCDCRVCFLKLCNKLLEISPLEFLLTKGISCLDPSISLQPTIGNKHLESTLNVLEQNKLVSGAKADSIKQEFGIVGGLQDFGNQMNWFSKSEGRFNILWLALVSDDENLLNFLIEA
ncbi:hypothetical protein PR048_012429 [Dryococelus australis]|uniref:Uncharacterized protein n=1 Tax=Dryococelus australis TaxID=614101 RepID=A0ABQ9HPM8_9NEOP|nr:hypothetical protein PR048_012429 [Dryococelus australis]